MQKLKLNAKEILIRVVSALCGWAILTICNVLPLWLEMPVVDKIKVGGYDANIMEEHTFAPGLFIERVTQNGNLQAGGLLFHNEKAAYFTLGKTICEIDFEKNETLDLDMERTAPIAPSFCDDRYYIGTGEADEIVVGVLGDGTPYCYDETWFDTFNSWDKIQDSLSDLLVRSQTEELTTREMAKLVGYTTSGHLLGWDGEHAVFWAEDSMQGRVLFQFVDKTGIVNVLPGSCTQFRGGMVMGDTIVYKDGGLLKTLNCKTLEEQTVNDPNYALGYFNFMVLEGHRILVWVAEDGLHTLDLDQGNRNFVEGDWYSEYRGLYMWKNHIILLRQDRGFHKWDYTV